MTLKRKSPYQRILELGRDFAWGVLTRRKTPMLWLDRSDLPMVESIYHRAIAADQLGYEVILEARDGKIELIYRAKITRGEVPLEFLP